MTSPARMVGLPAVALVLVSGVLGLQVANGGGNFEPLQPADPCAERVQLALASTRSHQPVRRARRPSEADEHRNELPTIE